MVWAVEHEHQRAKLSARLDPTAYIAREDFMLLWRLMDSGSIQAEVNIGGNFSGKPAEVYNTVAKFPAAKNP